MPRDKRTPASFPSAAILIGSITFCAGYENSASMLGPILTHKRLMPIPKRVLIINAAGQIKPDRVVIYILRPCEYVCFRGYHRSVLDTRNRNGAAITLLPSRAFAVGAREGSNQEHSALRLELERLSRF